MTPGRLLAVSDLHVSHPRNRQWVADLPPGSPGDWLLVAGDLAEKVEDIEWTLRTLRGGFGTVVWVPGNHDLWAHPRDPVKLRGEARYQHLVALCRELGVITPEDPYPVWTGDGGPAVIVPLFLLYDYTFRPDGTCTKAEALDLAYRTGVVGTDERHLYPDPYPSREAWCQARIDATLPRLAAIDPELPTILVRKYELPKSPEVARNWWPGEKEKLEQALKEKVFRGWPTKVPDLAAKPAGDKTHDGVRLRAWDFGSEEGVPLRLWLMTAGDEKPKVVVLNALGEADWKEWCADLGPEFAEVLQLPTPPKRDEAKFKQNRSVMEKQKWAFAAICPRGVGATKWAEPGTPDDTQYRRRFALVGQTLDGMRVWDVRRALQATAGGASEELVCRSPGGTCRAWTLRAQSLFINGWGVDSEILGSTRA